MREAINEESSKSHRLQEEISRLKSRSMETLRPGRIYNYSGKDFDKRGVVYALKSKFVGAKSSRTRITATRSSDEHGDAKIILENQARTGIISATRAKKNSWWCVDLTENYALYLTHYTLRHGQEQKWSVLRNWQLEGSVDGCKWIVLKNHKNDHGLGERKSCGTYCTRTWPIDGDTQGKAFRYFRIFQTGQNSAGKFGIFLSGIELYGVLVD
ncbi:E3 ubiquitin-protein ligase hecd-1-like [Acropora millepora]|uniref:E3 ubiquitin-protein ligase hecd-1-like n=1 Tax=Acropora millepora TaxID=45264 RepID=UPI001CF452EE|nr:E3 ubiquitin-protein ligase hecd-1-like [Acropora millepora]